MAAAYYHFVAWVRTGVSSLVDGRGEFPVRLDLGAHGSVEVPVVLQGPGRVASLDQRVVLRVTPASGAVDHPPNLLAGVDLVDPIVPWTHSGAPAAGTPGPAPWLVLVVIPQRPGIALEPAIDDRLAVLVIDDAAQELPDLNEAWAWAHAQVVATSTTAPPAGEMAAPSPATGARLLCPRRLEPRTSYLACVVPAYEVGRLAGLGEAVTGDPTRFAWTSATTTLRLPVYYQWAWATGDAGDFAELARRIQSASVGRDGVERPLDATRPGWLLPDMPDLHVQLAGALQTPGYEPAPLPPGAAAFAGALTDLFDRAQSADPPLPPPLYGALHTGKTRLAEAPSWMRDLNLDPRLRAIAGLGMEIVRRNQDAFVDATWRELGDADAANQIVRQGQLASLLQVRLRDRHVRTLPDGEIVQLTSPLHTRLEREIGATFAREVDLSALPTASASSTFRRMARRAGGIGRRVGTRPGAYVSELDRQPDLVAPPRDPVEGLKDFGLAAFDEVSEESGAEPLWETATREVIEDAADYWKDPNLAKVAAKAPLIRLPETGDPWEPGPIFDEPPEEEQIDEFTEASARHQDYIARHLTDLPLEPARGPRLGTTDAGLAPVAADLVAGMAPEEGLRDRVQDQVPGHTVADGETGYAAVLDRAVREVPLVDYLTALSVKHLLPGIAAIGSNSIALLAPNARYIAALLVGANHALSAELAWRGVPADVSATRLLTFWGGRTRDAAGAWTAIPDIPPISSWSDAGPPADTSARLLVVVRGDLVARHPDVMVTMVKGVWNDAGRRSPGEETKLPTVQVALSGDTRVWGFDLDPGEAVGGDPPGPPGWYVVLAEHPTNPRFGLEATAADTLEKLPGWSDLSWEHLAAEDLDRGRFLRARGPLAGRHPVQTGGLAWGADAAHVAAISLRRAFRVARHASTLISTEDL
jgi:hypothetical protein